MRGRSILLPAWVWEHPELRGEYSQSGSLCTELPTPFGEYLFVLGCYTNSSCDTYSDFDAHTGPDRQPVADCVADRQSNADLIAECYAIGFADCDAIGHPHAVRDAESDRYPHPEPERSPGRVYK